MIAIIHMLVGAGFGAVLSSAPSVVIVSFFSHYLLDRIPHIDPETFAKKNIPYSWKQLITLLSDTLLTLIVAALFFLMHKQWALILLGITASMLPDLLMPLEKYTFYDPLQTTPCTISLGLPLRPPMELVYRRINRPDSSRFGCQRRAVVYLLGSCG